ncbi:MAG: hypothetical protein IKO94_06730 [Selenomonadaceae bacterium]|nr:hypothetical protein [Selenomonadaceae bacterium]
MKDATKERVEEEIADWEYLEELPPEWFGSHLQKILHVEGDVYDLYGYANEDTHRSATAYFHEETKEYKVRVQIGLIEFCHIEFVTGNFQEFEKLLRQHFEPMLRDLAEFNPKTVTSLLLEKGVMEWEYGGKLPPEAEGFRLFIRPSEPVRINNGSYIVFDYVDFSIASNFTIYYNIFRDEFFGEARIRNIPVVTYSFDSNELPELEANLECHMLPYLQEIRRKAEGEGTK